jgi:diguanylate cyclase (GGDEF)-like protein
MVFERPPANRRRSDQAVGGNRSLVLNVEAAAPMSDSDAFQSCRRSVSGMKRVELGKLAFWSRIASCGLMTVLVASTVFGFEAARTTRESSAAANAAAALDDAFSAARYAVGSEESLERKYRLEPGKDVFAQHRASAAALVSALDGARRFGNAEDRFVADKILQAHIAYLAATRRMFAAVDRHDTRLVIALDHGAVDPIFDAIQRTVEKRAAVYGEAAKAALGQLGDRWQWVVTITTALSALGLICLGIFFAALLTYQRRMRSGHEAELTKLEEAALTDNLTGIGNHRAYQEELTREVAGERRSGESLSLAVMDVDDFKIVNDRNGHMRGDHVLTTLAALLQCLQGEKRAFRIGGDEFAVVLPRTTAFEAQAALQRLRTAVRDRLSGTTVTIGIATLSGADCNIDTLQARADAAMYAGKAAGRDCLTEFNASMAGMWLRSPKKVHSLRQLIDAGSVQIAFQPIWEVDSCRVLAYEALARPDPQFGFAGPQEAFDLAERIGRAHELDAICRHSALAAAGNLPADALLFINVSPQSLDHGRLDPVELRRKAEAAGLSPERIVIEITERSITGVGSVIAAARTLQEHGFRLALDDTGAGNSGLEILGRLTFDFLKIDRDVIVKAMTDKNARGVLAGIIAIGSTTGAYVIAEGIENIELLDFVCRASAPQAGRTRGIHGVQGYLLKRPASTFPQARENDDVAALLKEFFIERRQVR